MNAIPAREISERIKLADGFRTHGHANSHNFKEWMHFCVFTNQLCVLVNISLVIEHNKIRPRLTLLIEGPDGWQGDIVDLQEVDLDTGKLNFNSDKCGLKFEDGAYHVKAVIPEKGIRIDFQMEPDTSPVQTPSVQAGSGNLRWLCIPRCQVNGEVQLKDTLHHLHLAPGYHDHNWGNFDWGGNFSWRWGYFTLGSDLAIVVSRILDKLNHRVISDSFIVSYGNQLKDFRGHQVHHTTKGISQLKSKLTLPGIMGLALKPGATLLSDKYSVIAEERANDLTLNFHPETLATIGMPSGDRGTELSTISELSCHASLRGTLNGEHIDLNGRGIWEVTGCG